MRSIIITPKGTLTEAEINRKDLSDSFGIHLRDLRPVFALRQIATISPRGKCIVVNLRTLKLVIGAKQAYILNIDNPDVSQKFVPTLVRAIENNTEKHAFELLVLEVALTEKLAIVREEYEKLEKSIEKGLSQVQKSHTDLNLEKVLNLKKALSKLGTKVREIQEELVDILNDDEEMEEFYLSSQPQNQDIYAIESLLEFVEEPFEEIWNNIQELKENIDDTQEFITFMVNNRRNAIIRFDLVATLVTAVFSFLAVVTGLYGMNVQNNFGGGGDAQGFWLIVIAVGLIGIVSILALWSLMRKKNIL